MSRVYIEFYLLLYRLSSYNYRVDIEFSENSLGDSKKKDKIAFKADA